jgi:hypothetical protein
MRRRGSSAISPAAPLDMHKPPSSRRRVTAKPTFGFCSADLPN